MGIWQRSRGAAIFAALALATAAAAAQTRDFDGQWSGTYFCTGFWRQTPLQVTIDSGKVQSRVRWANGSSTLDGKIAADGDMSLSGMHVHQSYEMPVQLRGKAQADMIKGDGTFNPGQRGERGTCTFTLQSVAPHPESLRGRELAALKAPIPGTSPEQQAAATLDFIAANKGDGQAASAAPTVAAPSAAATPPERPVEQQVAAPVIAPAAAPVAVASTCAIDVAPMRTASGTKSSGFDAKPKLYALSVGVSRYAEATMNLQFAAKDACDMARALAAQQGGLYRQVEVRVVQDEAATRDGVLDGLDWILRQTTARDVAVVFLAGHGVNDATGEYFFLPHDANLDRLARSAIPQSDIRRSLMQVAGKALFFFDTCHSGQIMASRRALPPDVSRFVETLTSAENSVVVFSASTGRQFAIEDASWGNGAFTKALLEGLGGRADYRRDKVITISEIDLYLSERVKELTGGRQAPTTAKPASTQDFPIAVVR